jgi:hypothetical protein
MSLKTHAKSLTASDQVIFEVPQGVQASAHGVLITGSGTLTLKYFNAAEAATYTIYSGLSITDEKTLDKAFDFSSGDKLIASGDSLSIFASVYSSGGDGGTGGTSGTYGPGPQELIDGNMTSGFFGEVSSYELFSGDELAFLTGVTEGTSQNSDIGWLKFAHNGKIKYIAKKSLRYSASWDHLYSRGLVYGTDDNGLAPRGDPVNQLVKVKRAGSEFIVRMMTGANADPFAASDPLYRTDDMYQMDIGGGSEWNELIYRASSGVPSDPATDGYTADRHGGPQAGTNLAEYSESDLGISSGNGRYTWCQEQSDEVSAYRVIRGYSDLASFFRSTGSNTNSSIGWRPALELVTSN